MTIARIAALAFLLLNAVPGLAEPERLVRSDVHLQVYWQGDFDVVQKNKMREWLNQTVDAMLLLNGQAPREKIRIELKSINSAKAVSFARVLRDNPQGIAFYINPNRPLDEFVSDWTAYHEFTHLFIEYPGQSDIWFSEGLASYYQNIVRYRAGLLSASEVKAKLRAGFESAENQDMHSDLTLEQLGLNMRERRAYMRVYWSGALYFLEADMALRESGSENSKVSNLDDVLRIYGECCLTFRQRSGLRIAEEFDQIAGVKLFVPLYESYRQSMSIPDYVPIMDSPSVDLIFAD